MSEHSHVRATGGRSMTDGRTPDGRPGLPEGLAQLIKEWRQYAEGIAANERDAAFRAATRTCADELAAVCAAHLEAPDSTVKK